MWMLFGKIELKMVKKTQQLFKTALVDFGVYAHIHNRISNDLNCMLFLYYCIDITWVMRKPNINVI